MSPDPAPDLNALLALVLREVQDISAGALFWVEESLWREKLPPGYDSIREGHPGASSGYWNGDLSALQMFYGSSNPPKNFAFMVCYGHGLSRHKPADHTTYFGHFEPVMLEGLEFLSGRLLPRRVRRNGYKRWLDQREIDRMNAWWDSWNRD